MEKENKADILQEPLVVINVGLKGFAENLEAQEADVIQVDWAPPAGGDQEMIDLLKDLL
jgi:FdrA protein